MSIASSYIGSTGTDTVKEGVIFSKYCGGCRFRQYVMTSIL